MKPQSPEAVSTLARGLDLAGLLIAFALSAWLASGDGAGMPFQEIFAIRVKVQNILLFVGMVLMWALVLTWFGLYRSYIYRRRWREVTDVVLAVSACTAVLWIAHHLFSIALVGHHFLLSFWLLSMGLCSAARLGVRFALRQLRRGGHNLRHLLIVGTSPRAVKLAERVQAVPELGYRVVGFVDEEWAGSAAFEKNGYPIVCDFTDFGDFIAKNVVDEVMVCLPVKSFYERCADIVARCEEQGITTRMVSDVFTPTRGRAQVETFDDRLVLTIQTGGMRGWAMAVKRLVDFTLAAIALLVLSALLLTIAVLIKLRDPGPILFAQERMGINKRRFRLYKFRTMVVDAEKKIAELEHLNEVSGPVFKIRNDPRITSVGRFLRKTSLDELPQLLNVLRGDMSLVGPRPLPVRDYQSFSTAWHRRRFSVKPGITCLWQVMGRNSIPFERWMELDMQYIDQWSLMLDLRILLKTIPAVVKGSGV